MGEDMKSIKINGKDIGRDFPPYVVAELSANHNGSIDIAKKIIEQASATGVDAIKLQTYTPETLTLKSEHPDFLIKGGLWDGYTLYDLYKQAYTPYSWHKELFDFSRKLNITCFSSPFDHTAVDLLEDLNAPAYKIASFEVIDLPLIKYAASTKKPLIISTGIANLKEIEEAVEAAKSAGCKDLILLHCISSYPAPIDQSNLRTIPDLSEKFGVITGLSDHSMGNTAAITSVALGSCFIEKHFKLSEEGSSPDSSFSITPNEMKNLCRDVKNAWLALGKAGYETKEAEKSNKKFRRSLYFVNPLQPGDTLSITDIRSIRPGYGLAPKYIENILGKKMIKAASFGDSVQWDYFE
jgi:N-acetylneuraminate synthase